MIKVAVSACLLGNNCKYNGKNNKNDKVLAFLQDKKVYEICPEVLGGLSTPRYPSERIGSKVLNTNNEDVTKQFKDGANKTLDIITKNNIKLVILKANSPSCGKGKIYDGTFSSKLVDGDGVLVELLKQYKDIVILSEFDL